jgi:hypothetical protein
VEPKAEAICDSVMFKNWSKGTGVAIGCELVTVTDTEETFITN